MCPLQRGCGGNAVATANNQKQCYRENKEATRPKFSLLAPQQGLTNPHKERDKACNPVPFNYPPIIKAQTRQKMPITSEIIAHTASDVVCVYCLRVAGIFSMLFAILYACHNSITPTRSITIARPKFNQFISMFLSSKKPHHRLGGRAYVIFTQRRLYQASRFRLDASEVRSELCDR